MTHFYKVIRGRVIHNGKSTNPGEFIYATPQEMEGVAGVGSVMQVDKTEVSFAFLQQNNLLHLVSPAIAPVPQDQPFVATQILISEPTQNLTTPTEQDLVPPEIPPITEGSDTEIGLSLGVDPAVKAEATERRKRGVSSTANN